MAASSWLGAETALDRMSRRIVQSLVEMSHGLRRPGKDVMLVQGWDGVGRCAALRYATSAVTQATTTLLMYGWGCDIRLVPVTISMGEDSFMSSLVRVARARDVGLPFWPDGGVPDLHFRPHLVVVNEYQLPTVDLDGLPVEARTGCIYVFPTMRATGGGDYHGKTIVEEFDSLSQEEAMGLLQLDARDALTSALHLWQQELSRRRLHHRLPTMDSDAALGCFLYCTLLPQPFRNPVHHWRAEGLLGHGFHHSPEAARFVGILLQELQRRCMVRVNWQEEDISICAPLVHKALACFTSREAQRGRGVLVSTTTMTTTTREFPSANVEEWRTRDIHRISLAGNADMLVRLPLPLRLADCCPNLRTLIITECQQLRDIPDDVFFPHMPHLRVLDLSSTSIVKLPSSLPCCSGLLMLSLNNCNSLETLSPVIETGLQSLEVLDIEHTPLPEMTKLSLLHMHNLKALCFNNSSHKLEELDLFVNNGIVFEGLSIDGYYETEFLMAAPLRRVHICIGDSQRRGGSHMIIPERFTTYKHLGQQVQLHITHPYAVGVEDAWRRRLEVYGGEEVLQYSILGEICNPDFISLYDNQADMIIDSNDFESLRCCRIKRCNQITTALKIYYSKDRNIIEDVYMSGMRELRHMCSCPFPTSLSLLARIHIECCPNLTSLFSGSTVQLPVLTEMQIRFCARLQSVFEEKAYRKTDFPALERLTLLQLPRLSSICDGHLTSIKKLKVRGCWKLRDLPLVTTTATGDTTTVPTDGIVEVDGETEWWNKVVGKAEFNKELVKFKRALNPFTVAARRQV